MKKVGLRAFFALACVALIASFAMPALGQSKSLEWTRMDADITVLQNGDLQIKETNVIHFTSGTFSFGYRDIDTQRLTDISNVSVTENGQPLRIETGYADTNKYRIKYYFPTAQNQTRTFVISYTAKGATRYYAGGDQVYWVGVYADRNGFAVQSSKLTITLPAGATATEIGAYGPRANVTGKGESVITAIAAESIPSGIEFEVRAQFPHGLITGSAPAWQAAYDKQRDYEQNTQPKIDLGFLLASLLLAVGGPGAAVLMYVLRGKDPNVGLVAEYLTEPPDIAPGVGGTLVDEKADLQDIIATLVDLARRGVLTMSEGEPDKKLGFATREYTFGLGPKYGSPLSNVESQLVKAIGLSQSNESVGLGEIKNRFYTKIPGLKRALYQELQTQGLYNHDPEAVRNSYTRMGWFIVILGVLSACLFLFVAAGLSGMALCLPVGLVISGIAVLIIAPKMPLRTRKGADMKMRVDAFKRYLQNIEKYENLKESADKFDAYLPWAIALGVDKTFIQKYAAANIPAPDWYEPYPGPVVMQSPYGGYGYPRRSYPAGGSTGSFPSKQSHTPDITGAAQNEGQGGIGGLDKSLGAGLSNMSAGLTGMFTAVSSAMTSVPAPVVTSSSGGSSWHSSSGGWSSGSSGGWSGGGGSFGGGGSGGGGGGFG